MSFIIFSESKLIKDDEILKKINALKLYIEKPHLINKKIYGAQLKWVGIGGTCLNEDFVSDIKLVLNNVHNKTNLMAQTLKNYKFEVYGENIPKYPWSNAEFLSPNFRAAFIREIISKGCKDSHPIIEVVIFGK